MSKNTSQMIVKSNHLVEASYRLELSEQRAILMAIFLARENGLGITSDKFLTITAADYAAMFGIDINTAYEQLQSVGTSLYERTITLNDIHEPSKKPRKIQTRWVSAVSYVPDAALVQIQFSGVIVPYITKLEREFTSYKISMIAKMTSIYAIRLYELLIQWGGVGHRTVMIQDLKNTLAIDAGYAAIKDFKKRVVDPAVEQINKYTDIQVSYENVKDGRSICGLKFIFTKNDNLKVHRIVEQPKTVKKIPPATGLTIAEKTMVKQLCAKTGLSDAEIIKQALSIDSDLFMGLDSMLKNG
jgi:plasmid replication initiation protein